LVGFLIIMDGLMGAREVEGLVSLFNEAQQAADKRAGNAKPMENLNKDPNYKPPDPIPEHEKNFRAKISGSRGKVPEKVHADDEKYKHLAEPKFQFSYAQHVTSQDTYGYTISKDVYGTTDCTDLIIKIELPGEKLSDLDLDITDGELKLISKKYYLRSGLPVELVKGTEPRAKFDKDIGQLTLRCTIACGKDLLIA